MTEKLKALLDERASAPDFVVPDLAAVRAAGTRRRRRHRGAVALGGLATAAAITALVATGLPVGTAPDAGPPVATDPSTPARGSGWSYAVGSVIHDASGTTDVGHPVRVYVRTRLGYVTADDAGRVWLVAGGRVDKIGQADPDGPTLVSDPALDQVAWIDVAEDGAFVVHDLERDLQHRYPTSSTGEGPALYALAGGLLYVRDGGEAVAIDPPSGTRSVVREGLDERYVGLDADGGRVAVVDDTDAGGRAVVGPAGTDGTGAADGAGVRTLQVVGGDPLLSPGGDYLGFGDDEGAVLDVATGRAVALDRDGFYEPYEWWDDTTLAVIAETAPGSGRATLVGCDVLTGRCAPAVADLGPFDEIGDGFSLPVGER